MIIIFNRPHKHLVNIAVLIKSMLHTLDITMALLAGGIIGALKLKCSLN